MRNQFNKAMGWISAIFTIVFGLAPKRIASDLMFIFADGATLEKLRERAASTLAAAKSIQEQADADGRELTAEEVTQVEDLLAAFDATEIEIKRKERLAAAENRLNASTGRVTTPAPAGAQAAGDGKALVLPDGARIDPSSGYKPGASKGTGGFVSQGEYALSVRSAVGGHGMDPRLRPLAAPNAPNQESNGADGGYLVPPDYRTQILQKVLGEDGLLGRTDQQTTTSNSITMPVDETTPWQTSGGVQVYWEGEGQQVTGSKLALQSTTIRAHKISALVAVTDELLEDANGLTAYLSRKVGDKVTFKLNDALINGTGNGQPQGVLNAPALVTQAAEGGQTADTVNYANITKMWARLYGPCRRNAVWLCNQDIEPQLANLTAPGNTFPAYVGPGGLTNNPYNGTLMGRPIVYTEATAALGDVGDILLVDLSQYMTLMKSGGVRSDISIHLWFDYSVTAFRFTLRIGGQSWWSAAITRAKSANTLSCFVALAAR